MPPKKAWSRKRLSTNAYTTGAMKVSAKTTMNGATKSQPRHFRRGRRAAGARRAGTGAGGAAVDVIVSPSGQVSRALDPA
ncbi:hypothetical protein GCM10017567_53110 [Amycolatopsis bullii]|uniref:Uncharacterized protein n=1 Tax=Amycolatopsis bullii TaxID=941987 RepID=A0ABQ3KI44_9PSEU|nr:hypothetical protein GCM10017567_53110 [Amycolatopsis bullii]